jgi:hypothetical protein
MEELEAIEDKKLAEMEKQEWYRKIWQPLSPVDGGNDPILIDVAADCWGALIYIIVNDFPDLLAGRVNQEQVIRVVSTLTLFTVNMACQLMIVFFICSRLMLPGMLSAQNVYKYFHEVAFFENGNFDGDAWHAIEDRDKICELAVAQGLFVRVIIFLWLTTNLLEINKNVKQRQALMGLPSLPDDQETWLMVRDECGKEGDQNWIIMLNTQSKVLLIALVYIPKRLIVLGLIFAGSCWLLATEKVSDLILNSLALAFVVEVDELIATTFFPDFFLDQLEKMYVATAIDPKRLDKKGKIDNAKEGERRSRAFRNSALVVVFSIVFVELIMRYQPILPGFTFDVMGRCQSVQENEVPWCLPWQRDCFGYGED